MSRFGQDRQRRIIYNDDGDQMYSYDSGGYDYGIVDEQSFLGARTTRAFDTHVDTYVWCVGNGADPPWGCLNRTFLPCLGSEWRAADIIIDACHANGLEVWASLRLNDIHDSFMAKTLEGTFEPAKAEHPDWLLGTIRDRDSLPVELIEKRLWSALNFEREEVRNYRLGFIAKTAAAHDFDGYDLDFTRFVWDFELGRETVLAPLMTDFVRQTRVCLNAIGRARGRPYTFVVHVMDSLEKSLLLGQDVEAWLEEGLVDVLTVGMGYLPYAVPMGEWQALGARYGVPVYPSLNTNTFIDWYKQRNGPKRFDRVSAWHDALRATAAWWWANGADGINIFNLYCQEDERIGPLPSDLVYQPLGELGDPAVLAGKDKLYGIGSSNRGGFCHHGSEATPLPVPLGKMERKLPLAIGPDADDPKVSFTIHFWTSGGADDVQVYMRLNHRLFRPVMNDDASEGEHHYVVDAGAGVMRSGFNELSLWCSVDIHETSSPMIVHEVLVEAGRG